jgi:hypothetical protein
LVVEVGEGLAAELLAQATAQRGQFDLQPLVGCLGVDEVGA